MNQNINLRKIIIGLFCTVLFSQSSVSTALAQGLSQSGVGSINRSMGGASTALPLDSAGAIHWNPATIAGLSSSEAAIGAELLWPETEVSSSIDALGIAGSTDGDNGPVPIINASMVKKFDDSPFTAGLAFLTVAGFRVDYPADPSNPILSPQPPVGGGLGRVFGNAEVFQVVPTLAYDVDDKLSIGFAPTLTVLKVEAVPLFIAAPNSNGSYPNGSGTQHHLGGGFQLGAYYEDDNDFNYGASLKSPQWIESLKFDTVDELGLPRHEEFNFDYPMIASVGASYTGLEQWAFALDVRYFDYSNTDGFEETGFASSGAVQGLGWDGAFAAMTGAQYQVSDKLSLRAGYFFIDNPISDENTLFNVASPLIVEHIASLGVSYEVAENLIISAAVLYGFENDTTGSLKSPLGDIPGTSVRNETHAYVANIGATLKF